MLRQHFIPLERQLLLYGFSAVDITDIALKVIGAFYAFAGLIGSRAGLMSIFFDKAIAAISMKKISMPERIQSAWLVAASGLVFLGGVLLLVGLEAAVWVFALSTLAQAFYLYVIAPRYFDADNPPDTTGRRQTTNAFVIYFAATAFIVWAAWHGRLMPLADLRQTAALATVAALVLYLGYVFKTLWWQPKPRSPLAAFGGGESGDGYASGPALPAHECTRIKLMCDYQCDPLWALDEDRYGCFSPDLIEISDGLRADLKSWAQSYDTSFNLDDFSNPHWSDAQYAAHEAEGRRLAGRLKRERPDLMVFVMEPATGVVEIHATEPA
ncbi:hypothetical protein APY04_1744 [Hyphomicrobium sulfonivorans]|uniref:Uncharacterized protein n=1 Tax=Hyphomicrobium sulfonivorans TaxID=121290 RepID=A0A109BHQ8_HYPSL|nr:hypothetical protein APY04_1744 [Hyphomicrobium sulfonivorans]